MALRLSAEQLLPASHACYYLSGGDADGVFETAELLLSDGEDEEATLLRVDISELALIHQNLQPGLFGTVRCHVVVRNAGSARPKQLEQLFELAAQPPMGLRLIVCAAGIDSKKALHKRMMALPDAVSCVLSPMDEAAFNSWLGRLLESSGLRLSEDAVHLLGERLQGMRLAARQAVERLRLFDDGEGCLLGMEEVGDLLGERSPGDLSALCRAVALRSPESIMLLRSMLREQQVAELQVLSWLSTRLQQLLLYSWHAATDRRNASRNAGLFGEARQYVPKEADAWQPQELMHAMQRMAEVESLLKGASLEDKGVVLERFVLELIRTSESQVGA
ncbi:MAG: DNA polymerase III subunit delta [Mariprofundaceae bacterium]|nr:DNA polymerase III subunit delta [Mariprofundaceae bacterium]